MASNATTPPPKADDGHQLVVRDVSRSLWLQVRGEAVKRGRPAGELLNEILREWLEQAQEAPR